jgi:hypothetical protein
MPVQFALEAVSRVLARIVRQLVKDEREGVCLPRARKPPPSSALPPFPHRLGGHCFRRLAMGADAREGQPEGLAKRMKLGGERPEVRRVRATPRRTRPRSATFCTANRPTKLSSYYLAAESQFDNDVTLSPTRSIRRVGRQRRARCSVFQAPIRNQPSRRRFVAGIVKRRVLNVPVSAATYRLLFGRDLW